MTKHKQIKHFCQFNEGLMDEALWSKAYKVRVADIVVSKLGAQSARYMPRIDLMERWLEKYEYFEET